MANLKHDIDRIDALLPQTQCQECGYPGCRPYAEAIVCSGVPFNQCPPGGQRATDAIATALQKPTVPHATAQRHREVAVIAEDACIGCAKCLPACPVDAILGAPKLMHTVLEDDCTGCGLCLPVCPVDCITLREEEHRLPFGTEKGESILAKQRYQAHQQRAHRRKRERSEALQKKQARAETNDGARQQQLDEIKAAVARVKAQTSISPQ